MQRRLYPLFSSVIPSLAVSFSPLVLADSQTSSDADESDFQQLEEVVATYRPAYRGGVEESKQPQAIETVDREQLAQAGITDFQSALDFTPTVSRQNDMAGLWDAYTLRGFPSDENMPASYLINGFSGGKGYSGRRDTANIEKIEVLLGPGSALYGRSDPGGTINIITRKPEFFTEGHVTAEVGSFNHKRLEADLTGALSDNIAGRVNGAVEKSDSFRDEVTYKKQTLTPSLLWDLGENGSLLYEAEYVLQEAPFDRGIIIPEDDINQVDHSTFYGEPSDGPMSTKVWGNTLSYELDFADDWVLSAGVGVRKTHFEGYSSEPDLSAGRQEDLTDDDDSTNTVYRMRRYADYKTRDHFARAEISGSLETGSVVHNLMLGADTYRYFVRHYQLEYRDAWGVEGGAYGVDLYNPVYGSEKPEMSVKKDRLEYQQSFGVYAQNQMELTERLQLLVGARFDKYHQSMDSYKEGEGETFSNATEISPRYGLTYELADGVQVYANHATGFMPVNGADENGTAYEPEKSRSNEIGAKIQRNGWQTSLAVFDAYKSNILTANTESARSAQVGEIRSTGVEFNLSGQLTPSTQLMFAYAWLDARTTNSFVDADWWVEIPAGTQVANVPENTVFVNLNQDFALAGYAAHAGASYQFVDERQGSMVDTSFRLPSYSLVDLNLGVDFGAGLSSALAVTNLLNESYILNSYARWWSQPGEPRAVKASLTYDF